jgi:hypothetical protein
VRRAVEAGGLPASRLEGYLKLVEERRQLEEKMQEKEWLKKGGKKRYEATNISDEK